MSSQKRVPTHRCTRCGALWILQKIDQGSWSLFSLHCGPCCDNAAMGAQIEPLAVTGSDATLHPSVDAIMRFFDFSHLPANLLKVSAPFAELAWVVANEPQKSAETTIALRKLLEAKDCAVRAALS